MKTEFTLAPSNYKFIIESHFPKLSNHQKMGVFLSGGMESSLISLLAREYYGKERVVFFYSDNIFSSNDPDRNSYIHTNINRAAKLLDIVPTYLDFNYDAHVNNRKQSINDKMENLKTTQHIEFVMFGFTKLFFDVEIFKQSGMTIEMIKNIAYADPILYKSTIEEFHLDTERYIEHLLDIDIPAEVYPLLRQTSGFIKSPFKNINKSEVVDLYRQLGLLDKLYGTSSCIRDSLTVTGKHCGDCFNCQQRWDAFKILGTVQDLTEYNSDNIKHYREELENVIHS